MEVQGSMLVCDSGSTKATWCLVTDGERKIVKTQGYNPFFIDTDGIVASLRKDLLSQLHGGVNVLDVFFYGAGCSSKDKNAIVEAALKQVFPQARTFVAEDLLAAARALLQRKPGFAAILGTGTNSALYDGERLTHVIDSLGYFLGDEGSGSYIGKKLLRDFLRRQMPGELHNAFAKVCSLSRDEILDTLYNKPTPNRFLASFARFATDHNSHPYIVALVEEGFDDFFKQLVSRYPDYQKQTFACIGSIGHIHKEILQRVCERWGMPFGRTLRDPIDALVDYHLS